MAALKVGTVAKTAAMKVADAMEKADVVAMACEALRVVVAVEGEGAVWAVMTWGLMAGWMRETE